MNHKKETCSGMLKLKKIKSEMAKMQCLFKQKQNGNAVSKLCAAQATKNGSVDRSAEPVGVHWDEEMANK